MIKITTALTVLALTVVNCREHHVNRVTGLEGKEMPDFEIMKLDSTVKINTRNILPGKPILLFSFEPWCPYSRAQTQILISHFEDLKAIDIYMFCSGSFSEFENFCKQYGLSERDNFHVGVITDFTFYKYFRTSKIPLLAIYDKRKKLKDVSMGVTDVSIIKDIALQ
jgi:thiol-disulfide isomerase/thioredoxin